MVEKSQSHFLLTSPSSLSKYEDEDEDEEEEDMAEGEDKEEGEDGIEVGDAMFIIEGKSSHHFTIDSNISRRKSSENKLPSVE